jgi:hypothetical protein
VRQPGRHRRWRNGSNKSLEASVRVFGERRYRALGDVTHTNVCLTSGSWRLPDLETERNLEGGGNPRLRPRRCRRHRTLDNTKVSLQMGWLVGGEWRMRPIADALGRQLDPAGDNHEQLE